MATLALHASGFWMHVAHRVIPGSVSNCVESLRCTSRGVHVRMDFRDGLPGRALVLQHAGSQQGTPALGVAGCICRRGQVALKSVCARGHSLRTHLCGQRGGVLAQQMVASSWCRTQQLCVERGCSSGLLGMLAVKHREVLCVYTKATLWRCLWLKTYL